MPSLVPSLVLAAACARAPSNVGGLTDELSSVTFAPEAEVDLAAMRRESNGLYVRDVSVGTGRTANDGVVVQVAYSVRLVEGQTVDAASQDDPMRFRIGDPAVLRAFSAGVRGMKEGGMRQLVVPPRLAYGARQVGAVPPNAVLVMFVYLVRVE